MNYEQFNGSQMTNESFIPNNGGMDCSTGNCNAMAGAGHGSILQPPKSDTTYILEYVMGMSEMLNEHMSKTRENQELVEEMVETGCKRILIALTGIALALLSNRFISRMIGDYVVQPWLSVLLVLISLGISWFVPLSNESVFRATKSKKNKRKARKNRE